MLPESAFKGCLCTVIVHLMLKTNFPLINFPQTPMLCPWKKNRTASLWESSSKIYHLALPQNLMKMQ